MYFNVKDELAQKAAYSKLTCENARNTTNKFVPQQQQQHSFLSQVSWDRLEMKPKRDEKQGDT
jgi:hypothetical protein